LPDGLFRVQECGLASAMKNPRIVLRRSIGLLAGDRELALSVAARTPAGWVEAAHEVVPYAPDQLEPTLERLLEPHIGRDKRTRWPVTLGLPTLRVYCGTRPISSSNPNASPHALLQEMLQATSAGADDMTVEAIRSTPGKRPLITLASARKKYLGGLITTLQGQGVRLARAEPAPCALLRLAVTRQRPPRGAKLVARFFLGPGHALGVLAAGRHPLLWRLFDLPAGGEAAAILAALSALRVLGRPCGIGLSIDAVVVHGRADLGPLFDTEELRARAGCRLIRSDGPDLDAGATAYGLALARPQVEDEFDLAREFKPRPPLREVIPWAEVGLQVSLLWLASAFLWNVDGAVTRDYAKVTAETARFRWLGSQLEGALVKEKKARQERLEAIETFLAKRVEWSAHTGDVGSWLPENVSLTSFQGHCELEPAGGKKGGPQAKKSLVLQLSAPVPEHGAIDRCVAALRAQPLLKRDFPAMKLADLKWNPAIAGTEPRATFSVVCAPPGEAAPARPAAKAPAAKAKGG
jgi:hypothetical protein